VSEVPIRVGNALQEALECYQQGELARARQILRGAGSGVADDSLALAIFALSLDRSEAAEARALFERAVRIVPDDDQAHFNLGVLQQSVDNLPGAISSYRHALRLKPDHTGALNNLSDLLRRRGQSAEGWDILMRFLRAGGNPEGLEIRFAKMALDCRLCDEAEKWFARAEDREAGSAFVRWEHAMLLLAQGKFSEGWPRYEARLSVYGDRKLWVFPYELPPWDGTTEPGMRLLLHREQGFGDVIMFASWVDELIGRGIDLHLAVYPSLVRLFANSFKKAHVWSSHAYLSRGEVAPQRWLQFAGPLDAQAPMGSLGALLGATALPKARAYLHPLPSEVDDWKMRLDRLTPRSGKRLRVGLAMAARSQAMDDEGRRNGLSKSMPPEAVARLGMLSDIQWIGLHDQTTASLLADIPGMDIVDVSPWITDFADTAALIDSLDLVVSVDTAVAHLAGAMGKSTFVALRRNADWRWGLDQQDCGWYQAVRLFRQQREGEWAPVLEEIISAIEGFHYGC
jgi:tetratricopeptide (TPR) repeat protein